MSHKGDIIPGHVLKATGRQALLAWWYIADLQVGGGVASFTTTWSYWQQSTTKPWGNTVFRVKVGQHLPTWVHKGWWWEKGLSSLVHPSTAPAFVLDLYSRAFLKSHPLVVLSHRATHSLNLFSLTPILLLKHFVSSHQSFTWAKHPDGLSIISNKHLCSWTLKVEK